MHMAGQKMMMKNRILNLLFPPRCPVCDEILEPEYAGKRRVHCKCEKKLIPVGSTVCMHCGRPVKETKEYCFDCGKKMLSQSFVQGKALFAYQGAIRKTMYRFKYSNKREYADFFAEEAVSRYGEWIRKNKIEAIIPVPMYEPKRKRRGYNQAECFAKCLSQKTGIPMEKNWVKRIRDTAPQKELNDVQRKNNLSGAFRCREGIAPVRRVLLVDDIYTTGSTADVITEELLENGVTSVFFLSICIGEGM